MTMCTDDAHGAGAASAMPIGADGRAHGGKVCASARASHSARAGRCGARRTCARFEPNGIAAHRRRRPTRGRANQRPAPCCFCQRSMNAISSRCAAMIRRASCLSAGSLPLLNSTCAMSIAP